MAGESEDKGDRFSLTGMSWKRQGGWRDERERERSEDGGVQGQHMYSVPLPLKRLPEGVHIEEHMYECVCVCVFFHILCFSIDRGKPSALHYKSFLSSQELTRLENTGNLLTGPCGPKLKSQTLKSNRNELTCCRIWFVMQLWPSPRHL